MITSNQLASLANYLPNLSQLKDKNTALAVAQVWYKALEMSPWKSFDEAKFKEGMDNVTLISHVNSTVESALAVSRVIKKYHHIDFDEQLIITFGLLHDVDKIVEYVYDEHGELVTSEVGQKIQHGVLSAMLARDAGFDINMQHMIITHTPTQNKKPLFKEAILFGYIDLCDWELTCKYSK